MFINMPSQQPDGKYKKHHNIETLIIIIIVVIDI